MITIEAVSQTFKGRSGPVEAIRDIDLRIAEGEFLTVIGRSGCGKSTLLRMVAGLLKPTKGQVTVAGELVKGPRRDVAMVFQKSALLPWRSVEDNILLPVEIFGWRKADYRPQADRLLEMTGLTGFRKRLPHELSGGMQQRVALCRALIQSPKVMLMDEPFSALDAITRPRLQDLAAELLVGRTVLLVTHNPLEALRLGHRLYVLSGRPASPRGPLLPRAVPPRDVADPTLLAMQAELMGELTRSAELLEAS
jgi:NitT/TauT family transport system ATP-binding protein